ncbi:hypothetical protein LRS06_02135 [Hymenobacter sp. J193]|uniref:class I SAM-dependent methyltransferase n=1 Tax=Hymenobacter sp. J193 TaxID=2898429 RepID=UPI002151C555|nr:rRNA adenine N-6-methyltransferase family protein [Hymenobacter sp. J193]MCR5886590.1 hypothetical protein [Hymenobacter sp. J193]
MLPPFVEEFLRDPSTVGSLIPSSRDLTGKVVESIDFDRAACIVEYGPGTGVFTDELIKRRRADTVLVLMEVNPRFCEQLRERYAGQPGVHVIEDSADKTGNHLARLGIEKADYVVCGLPFTSLSPRLGWRVLEHTRNILASDGQLILFQYTLQNTRLFEKFFRPLKQDHVLLNLPPAYVLVYAPNPEPVPAE